MAFPTGYTNYDQITIDHTKIGSGGTTNQDLWLPLSMMSATAQSTLRSDGGDARFTLSDGTTQIAGYAVLDSSGVCIGFKFASPSLSDSTDTVIWLWYNGTDTALAASDTYGQDNVFDAATEVMYPFDGTDPGGSAPQITDATSNSVDGTTVGSMTTGDIVTAVAGNGLDLDGSNDVVEMASADIVGQLDDFSIKFTWKCQATGSEKILYCESDIYGGVMMVNQEADNRIRFYYSDGISDHATHSTTTVSSGTTYHIAATKSSTAGMVLYVDSTAEGTNGYAGNTSKTITNAAIGCYHTSSGYGSYGGTPFAQGVIDEFSLHSAALPAAWITTSYNNLMNSGTFFSDVTAASVVLLGTTPIDVSITVPDATIGSPLSGTVTLSGSPVNGATVNVYNNTDSTQATETTDASGNWSHIAKLGKNYEVTFEYDSGGTKYTATPHSYIET